MKTYEAQATRNGGWKITEPGRIDTPRLTLTSEEFGAFLSVVQAHGDDVLIHLFADDCEQCGAAPSEDHIINCQYVLD